MEKVPKGIIDKFRLQVEWCEVVASALRSGETPPGDFDDEVYANLLDEREGMQLAVEILEEHNRSVELHEEERLREEEKPDGA